MKKFKANNLLKRGQAMVLLIVIMVAGVIITSAAVMYVITNSRAASNLQIGEEAYGIAESGAENAILRLVRNPNYAGETLTVGAGTATITVSGAGTKTIVTEGVSGNFRRKIQVTGTYVNNIFTASTWAEID